MTNNRVSWWFWPLREQKARESKVEKVADHLHLLFLPPPVTENTPLHKNKNHLLTVIKQIFSMNCVTLLFCERPSRQIQISSCVTDMETDVCELASSENFSTLLNNSIEWSDAESWETQSRRGKWRPNTDGGVRNLWPMSDSMFTAVSRWLVAKLRTHFTPIY